MADIADAQLEQWWVEDDNEYPSCEKCGTYREDPDDDCKECADEMQDEPPEITKVIFDDLSETGE